MIALPGFCRLDFVGCREAGPWKCGSGESKSAGESGIPAFAMPLPHFCEKPTSWKCACPLLPRTFAFPPHRRIHHAAASCRGAGLLADACRASVALPVTHPHLKGQSLKVSVPDSTSALSSRLCRCLRCEFHRRKYRVQTSPTAQWRWALRMRRSVGAGGGVVLALWPRPLTR